MCTGYGRRVQETWNNSQCVMAAHNGTYSSDLDVTVGAGSEGAKYSRKPEIMADAAYVILSRKPGEGTGNFLE